VDLTQSAAALLALRQAEAAGHQTRAGTALPVKLLLEDGSIYTHDGHLEFTETTVDSGTGAVTVRAVFPNPEGLLLPGTYVRAQIATASVAHAFTVPQTAIGRDPKGGATLTVLKGEDQIENRPVTLGAAHGTRWIISEGLHAGDRVIIEGLGKLRPGLPIKAVPAGSAPTAAP
jgi:membrane fusion protein (multidrug efflux system)